MNETEQILLQCKTLQHTKQFCEKKLKKQNEQTNSEQ